MGDIIARGMAAENGSDLANMAKSKADKISIFEDFEVLKAWYPVDCTLATDTTYVRSGTKSLKVTTAAGGSSRAYTRISKTFGVAPKLSFYVYVSDREALSNISIYLSTEIACNNFFFKNLGVTTSGWSLITIAPTDWQANGTQAWTSNMITLCVKMDAAADKELVVYVDELRLEPEGTPRCIFTFDDARASVYNTAFPIMETAGIKGVIYASQNVVGTAGKCTVAQLLEMQTAGWDIANHTKSHVALTGLETEQLIKDELINNQMWLEANGFTKASKHVAYPGGQYNDLVLQAMKSSGMLTGRTIEVSTQFTDLQDRQFDAFKLSTRYLLNTTTVNNTTVYMDAAIKAGSTIIPTFHDIVAAPAVDIEYSTANFQALVDYVVAQRLPVVTISEWYDELEASYFKKV